MLEAVAELTRRVLTRHEPATDDELSQARLPAGPLDAERFPSSFDWVAQAHRRAEKFNFPQEKWNDVFGDAGWADAVRIANAADGIVAYSIFDGSVLRLLAIIDEQTTITAISPKVALRNSPDELWREWAQLGDLLEGFWTKALTHWRGRYSGSSLLHALSIDIGETAYITHLSDLAFRQVLPALGLTATVPAGGLTHLPSIRLAIPRVSRPAPRPPTRLLHIGDATNTLIGPWLEAAALAHLPGIEVRSLLDTDITAEGFRRQSEWAPVIIASCHGIINATDLLGSALGLGVQTLRMEDVATSDLEGVDLLFLAACEMGFGYADSHEREALSFANASLIGGSRYTVAPALPVNDLTSALLVAEFAAQLTSASPPMAYHRALEKTEQLTKAQFRKQLLDMWESLRGSALAQRMPWPAIALDPVIKAQIEAASDQQSWQKMTFVLSGF
jgi:hypothetical protein